jgi:polysaccharide pyruvyl transferase WcaK-like protein
MISKAAVNTTAPAYQALAHAGSVNSSQHDRSPIRVGLLEHCGTGNLGDDATVAAALRQINSRWPHASIIGLSLDPADSEKRHGIPCFPLRQSQFDCEKEWTFAADRKADQPSTWKIGLRRRLGRHAYGFLKSIYHATIRLPVRTLSEVSFLLRSLVVARHLDILVICGGGQLLDWGGPWRFPYTLFKWVALAKLGHAKCYFLNNGAGPLDAPLSRWFIRRALSLADYVSLRDSPSRELVRQMGFKGEASVGVDCAWGLQHTTFATPLRQRPDGHGLIIGLAPMAYRDPTRHWSPDEACYQHTIGKIARFGSHLVGRGHHLRLFSSDIWFDATAIADVESSIKKGLPLDAAARIRRECVTNIDDLLFQLFRVDCYVTCRFHGVVFAHLLGVPALAIAPHPKVRALMEDFGLPQYCVDIADCDVKDLIAAFDGLVANIDAVRDGIRHKVASYQAVLTAQFDSVFANCELGSGARRKPRP